MSFAERADQLCDKLRDIEHQAADGDELFYCAYLLGLLGLHNSVDGNGEVFDSAFLGVLQETLDAENVTEGDQQKILTLWRSVCEEA